MWFTRISIRNPVFATMMMAAFLVLGLFSYQRLSVDQFPEVNFPVVVAVTEYPGASPESVETDLSRKIEEAVRLCLNAVRGAYALGVLHDREPGTIIAARNAAIVARWLARHQDRFAGSLPDAGVSMLLAPGGVHDDIQFATALGRSGVFVIPASTLGYPGQIRIGFGHRDPGRLEAALEALATPVAIPA